MRTFAIVNRKGGVGVTRLRMMRLRRMIRLSLVMSGMEPRKRTRSWPGLPPTGRPMDWDAWQRWLGWLGSRLPMN